jgi:hypothetical protein
LENRKKVAKIFVFFRGIFGDFGVLYSTLLHLPPLRFHCLGEFWDGTQDFDNGRQTSL